MNEQEREQFYKDAKAMREDLLFPWEQYGDLHSQVEAWRKRQAEIKEIAITDEELRCMVNLCPEKPGETVSLTASGKTVTLTYESRKKGLAELERRKEATKKGGR